MRKSMKRRVKAVGRSSTKKGPRRSQRVGSIRAVADNTLDWMAEAGNFYKPIKRPVTLRIDADVVAWFKAPGRGYQTRINKALRRVMLEERKGGARK